MAGISCCAVRSIPRLDEIEYPRCGIEVCSQNCMSDHRQNDLNSEGLSESDEAELGDFELKQSRSRFALGLTGGSSPG
jgi:hypothetical protein